MREDGGRSEDATAAAAAVAAAVAAEEDCGHEGRRRRVGSGPGARWERRGEGLVLGVVRRAEVGCCRCHSCCC